MSEVVADRSERWEVKPLSDLADAIQYGYTAKAKTDAAGIRYLRITDIQDDHVEWSTVPSCGVSEVESEKYLLAAGDLVFARTGATVGKSFLIRGNIPKSVFASYLIRVRLRKHIDPRYVAHFFQSPSYWNQIAESSAGIGQPNVNGKKLAQIQIPVAPPEQQIEIVAELEKQFSRIDEAVANLQRVKANLKRYKASVLKTAVEGRLVEIEGAWRQSTLGEEGTIIGGLTKNQKRNDLPLKLAYLRVANVYANELRLDEIEYIGVAERELEKLLVRKGDLLVVEGNGSPDQIGRVALWNDAIPNCVHQNHLIKARFGEAVLPEWALIWMLSPVGRHEIEKVSASTSGLHTLSVGKVSRLPISVPTKNEQIRIVAEVNRHLSILREVEAEVDANLQRAQALRQSVLSKAFSGELSPASSQPLGNTASEARPSKPLESAAVVMAARIIAAHCHEPTFGRVRLQKQLHLATYIAQVATNDEYARKQAGPLDMTMLSGVSKRVNDLGWFRETERADKVHGGKAYGYTALTKADEYKQHLSALTPTQQKIIDELIRLMRNWTTEQCELFSTVYAAWNDLILWNLPPTEQAVVDQVHNHWHESKKKFSAEKIVEMMSKIRGWGYTPMGFGRPTFGETADTASGDLFSSQAD